MEPLKKDAINIITNLPDDADIEEIMYRLYVLENRISGEDRKTPRKARPYGG